MRTPEKPETLRLLPLLILALSCRLEFVGAEESLAGSTPGPASSSRWWSLEPMVAATPPAFAGEELAQNPIDAFVLAKLQARGLVPSPSADRVTLIRRLSFDLIGLPPRIAEIEAFVTDSDPLAYERLVDRLLASPRHGERWARHWMDVAHFAETHGHDQDRIREHAWPYRDYLIASFNGDKPYGRFVEEQLAADVLYPSDSTAIPALGFLAAGPWDESTLRDIREDTIDRQIGRYLDRDDMVSTVMNTFVSVTVQCARCHDHKFDPVSARDYYALQACFAGVDRATRRYDTDPDVHSRRQSLADRVRRLEGGDRSLLLDPEIQGRVTAWEALRNQEAARWSELSLQTFTSSSGAKLNLLEDGSVLVGGQRPEIDTYTLTFELPAEPLTALRMEVLPDDSLPARGPGRAENGNFHLSEVVAQVFEPQARSSRTVKLIRPSADFDQVDWTITHAVDGQEATAWGIHPRVGETHQAVFELGEPLVAARGSKLVLGLRQVHGRGHLLGRFRITATTAMPASRTAILPAAIVRVLAIPAAERNDEDRVQLTSFVEMPNLRQELAALPPASQVYAAAAEFEPDGSHKPAGKPRPIHVLHRGDIHQPLEAAVPGALSCVALLPARFDGMDSLAEAPRRAALARWITARENPLSWRSIANRVWHHHFGRGLVATPNDFGRMGELPSHPELLDWLATWFRDDADGSLKALHRLLVTSATYRQSSQGSSRSAGMDPQSLDAENRLWWRMHRVRLDAESIRDAVLATAGDLDERMGGPSDRQFTLRPGIHVTPLIDYAQFDVGSPGGRRRSVYRFLFRTLPDPVMDALDCPAGDQLTPVRNASVTVQQALALWNSPFVMHHAERFARRIAAQESHPARQIELAVFLALGRPACATELEQLAAYSRQHGLASLCRLIFNFNEFAFVN